MKFDAVRQLEGGAKKFATSAKIVAALNDAADEASLGYSFFLSLRSDRNYDIAADQAKHAATLCRKLADALEAEAGRLELLGPAPKARVIPSRSDSGSSNGRQ